MRGDATFTKETDPIRLSSLTPKMRGDATGRVNFVACARSSLTPKMRGDATIHGGQLKGGSEFTYPENEGRRNQAHSSQATID